MPKILPGQTDLYALTDSRLSLGRPLEYIVKNLLDAGIKILQYREKKASMRQKYKDCILLRKLTNEYNACFIVNDHVDLAILSEADGVHIGQDDIPIENIRILAPNLIIGLSTHNPTQALNAITAGADYIGVGPIFATNTKEDVVPPVGFEYLDWVVNNINLPFVAIGGIKAHNISSVKSHGAKCFAMISELVSAYDIKKKISEIRQILAAA